MDYSQVKGLSDEVRERLQRVRPTTLVCSPFQQCSAMILTARQGAAKRMEGMTPTSAIYLLKYARRTWRATQEQAEVVHSADHRSLLKAATV